VPEQRIEDQRFGSLYDRARVTDDEEGPYLAALAALARDLDRERDGLLEHLRVHLALRRADLPEQL
jgi:hypothetical protein